MRIFHDAIRIFAETLPLSEAVEVPKSLGRWLGRIVDTRILDIRARHHLLIERVRFSCKCAVSPPVKVVVKLLEISISRELVDVGTLPLHVETLSGRIGIPIENHQIVRDVESLIGSSRHRCMES